MIQPPEQVSEQQHSVKTVTVGGLDLGKMSDPAAFVGCEVLTYGPPVKPKVEVVPRELWGNPEGLNRWLNQPKPKPPPQRRYRIMLIEEFEIGTPYHDIADKMVFWYGQGMPLHGMPLAMDWSGVGEPVMEIVVKAFRENEKLGGTAKAFFQPVRIVGGHASRPEGIGFHCSKEELVGVLMALFNNDQLEFSLEVPNAERLRYELTAFKEKKTKATSTQWEAEKQTDHDDLVMALALAAWVSERCQQDLKVWC